MSSKDIATTTQKPLLFCGVDSNHPLQGCNAYRTLFDLLCAPSYRAESLWHRVSALPAALHSCICSPHCTLTYRVARSLLFSRLSGTFSCFTDNTVSSMGLSSPLCVFYIPDITLLRFGPGLGC